MTSETFIDKSRVLSPAQDYEFLRRAGMEYIEGLSHRLWTDYNAHDPGITILEVLCYAITELGYRTHFEIKDLLASSDGTIENKTFYTAKKILTNAPLTPLDYRKMLIDIEGVNNAWLIHTTNHRDAQGYLEPLPNEVPVYINKKEDKLSIQDTNIYGESIPQLPIRGLNQIVVSLVEDDVLGNLNEVAFAKAWLADNRFVEVDITLEFDSWSAEKATWLQYFRTPAQFEFMTVIEVDDRLEINLKRTSDNTQELTLYVTPRDLSEMQLAKDFFDTEQPVADVVDIFYKKREKVLELYTQIDQRLRANRNLCEDWLCIETVQDIDIGICADIHLDVGADAEEVMAEVTQTILNWLNPPIRFYTLAQMLDKGYTTTTIFNGPSLHHGFLLDDEVEQAQLPTCLYASDIIAHVMDIPGVKAVNNLLLTAYDASGAPLEDAKNEPWCLPLDGRKQPVFAAVKSKLLLFREGIPLLLSEQGNFELAQGLSYLQAENNTYKLQNPTTDFEVPKGTGYALATYKTIQEEFPQTYGIGQGHLSDIAPKERKAAAKQLKAYLLHFDQLLADFFSQLDGARALLDCAPIDRTYFTQMLSSIPGIDTANFKEEGMSTAYQDLLEQGRPGSNDRSIYETIDTYYDRRNRALDHLLARFGVSFSQYAFMMHTMQQNAQGLAELTLQEQELINNKQHFLKKYPRISYARGLGIDYCQDRDEDTPWGIAERGGYEQRVAALLGIERIELEALLDNDPKTTWSYQTEVGLLKFKMMSTPGFTAAEAWELAQRLMNNVSAYRVETFSNAFIYFVHGDGKKIAKLDKSFTTEEEAFAFIPKLYQAINNRLENFYCIEHIQLRPLSTQGFTDDDLLSVCLNDDCDLEVNQDPYSFKATVVLPGWLARFRNRYFRQYAETIFRQEAPAHTLIKVCWVGPDDMVAFQTAYRNWIEAYCSLKAIYCVAPLTAEQQTTYNNALSQLISALKALNTIYDAGTLYDCQESELDNPIILNNSSLGSLENISL